MSAETTQAAEPKKTAAEKKAEALQKALAALPPDEAGPFRTPDGLLFVRILVDGHYEHWPLKSETFIRFIERHLYQAFGTMPEKKVIDELLRHFTGVALFEGDAFPVHLRVAEHRGNIVLDLCDEGGERLRFQPRAGAS